MRKEEGIMGCAGCFRGRSPRNLSISVSGNNEGDSLPPGVERVRDEMTSIPLTELVEANKQLAEERTRSATRHFSWKLAEMTDRHNSIRDSGVDVFKRLAEINRIYDPTGAKAFERLRKSLTESV